MKYSNISISGKICTGKSTVWRKLKKKLGWESFSTGQMFREYAEKNKLSIDAVEEQDSMGKHIDTIVHNRLKHEHNLILDTWVHGFMSKNIPQVLRVLLVCDDKERYRRFMKRENITLEKARERVQQREKKLLSKLAEMYNKDDILDPKHYNIVIDTTKNFPDKIVEKIVGKLAD